MKTDKTTTWRAGRWKPWLGLLSALAFPGPGPAVEFLRGDALGDGVVDISDAVCALEHLFLALEDRPCTSPGCRRALDANADAQLDISDPVYILNHLFLGGEAPPPPFPACGESPLPAGSLDCSNPAFCPGEGDLTLRIPEGAMLWSIWSESYRDAPAQHAVLSEIAWRAGRHVVGQYRNTPGLRLIESLRWGPELTLAAPVSAGTAHFQAAGAIYTHEYVQAFRTVDGVWTFHLLFTPLPELTLDCAYLDGESGHPVSLWAEIELAGGAKRVHYSCFHPQTWRTGNRSPYHLVIEDGTRLEVAIEESYLFRGVAGETANERIPRARVDFRDHTFDIAAHDRLIYAGLHHNAAQEYRLLFDEPVEGIRGIDIVTCPGRVDPCGFGFVFPPEDAKAHLLDAELQRAPALEVTEFLGGG